MQKENVALIVLIVILLAIMMFGPKTQSPQQQQPIQSNQPIYIDPYSPEGGAVEVNVFENVDNPLEEIQFVPPSKPLTGQDPESVDDSQEPNDSYEMNEVQGESAQGELTPAPAEPTDNPAPAPATTEAQYMR